jgi:hypothetical protein
MEPGFVQTSHDIVIDCVCRLCFLLQWPLVKIWLFLNFLTNNIHKILHHKLKVSPVVILIWLLLKHLFAKFNPPQTYNELIYWVECKPRAGFFRLLSLDWLVCSYNTFLWHMSKKSEKWSPPVLSDIVLWTDFDFWLFFLRTGFWPMELALPFFLFDPSVPDF